MAPIGADAAAACREPDILVPRADDRLEAVADRIEVARDRQAAPGAAVRQHRRRRHEPQLRDIVVEALGVRRVVGIGGGDAREQVLVRFAGQQIAVLQRLAPEIGKQRVAAAVDNDRKGPRHHSRRGARGRRERGAACCRPGAVCVALGSDRSRAEIHYALHLTSPNRCPAVFCVTDGPRLGPRHALIRDDAEPSPISTRDAMFTLRSRVARLGHSRPVGRRSYHCLCQTPHSRYG